MLSLCGERLISKVLDHYLHHDLIMPQLLITSLTTKEVMFLVALVCLSVDNITHKVMNGLG